MARRRRSNSRGGSYRSNRRFSRGYSRGSRGARGYNRGNSRRGGGRTVRLVIQQAPAFQGQFQIPGFPLNPQIAAGVAPSGMLAQGTPIAKPGKARF